MAGYNNSVDEDLLNLSYKNQLQEAKKNAREAQAHEKKQIKKIGNIAAEAVREKIAGRSDGIFYVLLIIAMFIDLLGFIDLGTFTSIMNLGIYILVLVGGFILVMFKKSSNRFSISYLLKGQLWKYAVIPLFELIPGINLIPFWTMTVILMWVRVSRYQ
jgi:hypothetical protein